MKRNKATADLLDFLDTLGDEPEEDELLDVDSQGDESIQNSEKITLLGTLSEMITGMILFGIVCELIGIWFVPNRLKYTLGVWIGIAIAAFMASHMAWTFNSSIDKDGKTATGRVRLQAFLRYFVVLGLFAVLLFTDFTYPLAAFLGIMGLKVSAYLQPLIHKIFKAIKK